MIAGESTTPKTAENPSGSAPTDKEDFRDCLATTEKDGRRRWVFPKKPYGRFYSARSILSWFLLATMFTGPFIRVRGNPLLLLNFLERKFVIFGHIFWPQDMIISAVTLLIFFTGIIVFTAAFGRLWCGWTCPQTVLMEMVFRKIEYLIEGDGSSQRALAKAPWSLSKLAKKATKHLIFFGLSFVVGNTLLAYFIGSEQLYTIVTDDPGKHVQGMAFMVLFTLLFYAIFARFREQACTFICPYGRLQSTLLDENSVVVAYDYKRGEKRGPLRQRQATEERLEGGHGDCIDCHQCVAVCPTGIDIRNGTQMECIHCTACIDACDAVMDKINRPRGLIRYASLNGIESGQPLRFTSRLKLYTLFLLALVAFWMTLVFTRSDVEATLLRAPGSLFQQMPNGHFSNLYIMKVINKTTRDLPFGLRLESPKGELQIMGKNLIAPREKLAESSILIELDKNEMLPGKTPIVIGLYSNNRRIETLQTTFMGPRDDTANLR